MSINIGSAEASAIKIGGADASAVYVGTEQLWPSSGLGPPDYSYPKDGVGYKQHGHSYGDRDVNPSDVNWAADQHHKISKCSTTSNYTCVAGDGSAFSLSETTVYLVQYKIRARSYQQGDSNFSAEVGVIAEKVGRPMQGIQTSFPNGGSPSAHALWGNGKEKILWWTASSSPSRETNEIPPEQMDLVPEERGKLKY